MSVVKRISLEREDLGQIAFVDRKDHVWISVRPIRWWDLASLIWWWLTPSDKKSSLTLTLEDGSSVKVHAVRVASKFFRIGKWQG